MDMDRTAEIVGSFSGGEITRRTGLHRSTISRIFSGKRMPTPGNMQQIADAIGVTIGELYTYLYQIRNSNRRTAA